MALQGSSLLLLLLTAALVVLGVRDRKGEYEPYNRFLHQHVRANSNGGNDAYCKDEMRRMKPKVCKEKNTFVHGSKNDIKAICTAEGGRDYGTDPNRPLRESIKSFRVTNCRHVGGTPLNDKHKGDCKYRASTSSRTIVIACEDGLPVHLDETLI